MDTARNVLFISLACCEKTDITNIAKLTLFELGIVTEFDTREELLPFLHGAAKSEALFDQVVLAICTSIYKVTLPQMEPQPLGD